MPASTSSSTHANRVVLVGTPETLSRLERDLAGSSVGEDLHIVGVMPFARRGDGPAGDRPTIRTFADLERVCTKEGVQMALVSLPLAMQSVIADVRGELDRLGVIERFIPTLEDLMLGRSGVVAPMASEVDLARLVGRQPSRLLDERIRASLRGRRVLITGAGGSIGSELSRLVAGCDPELLILMERSDNALFEIDRQLARFDVERQAILHDVVDAEGTLRLAMEWRPDVIFHAAAHKHVPMMEDHPAAAVNNNLFGTKSIADAALACEAERFVMISTDKAVNPSSVMGATKRLAEVYIRGLNERGSTRFSLVRFGNVLGSVSSVLTIWARQIAEGGPVTVTHPEMTRFFMTIPEAASLVIQASCIEGGVHQPEVFVLDMGEPIAILELARRFVRAHGLAPRVAGEPADGAAFGPAIDIEFAGVRPGEKLHEELAYRSEELAPTAISGILAWRGVRTDRREVMRMISDLASVRHSPDREAVLKALRRHVPQLVTMCPKVGISAGAA